MFFKRHTWMLIAAFSAFKLKCQLPKWPSAFEQTNECVVFTKWNGSLKQLIITHKSRDKSHTLSGEWKKLRGFPGGLVVKNPPTMQEMWVWSLGQKDHLEEEMAAHSSILIWNTVDRGAWLQSLGWQQVGHDFETDHTC